MFRKKFELITKTKCNESKTASFFSDDPPIWDQGSGLFGFYFLGDSRIRLHPPYKRDYSFR